MQFVLPTQQRGYPKMILSESRADSPSVFTFDDSFVLFVRQSHHNNKRIVFGKNITYQFVFLSMGNSPTIPVSVRENNSLLCLKSRSQPLIKQCKPVAVLTAILYHFF